MTDSALAYFRLIDLSGVPVPDFVEAFSFEEIRAAAIDKLLELQPDYVVLESDPAIKVIEAFSYREMLLRQRINDVARANTITEAVGNDLLVMGAGVNVEKLAGEDDESYRVRVQQGLALLAVAGPRNAYVAQAKAVSTAIVDVGVSTPQDGKVVVTVFGYEDVEDATEDEARIGAALFDQPTTGNVTRILARAHSALLDGVRTRLNADDIRPLTDSVSVRPPDVLEYSVSARLAIYPGPDAETVRAASIKRLNTYLQGVRKVSYDSTLVGLSSALAVPGVQNLDLESPVADVVADDYGLTVCTSRNVVVDRVRV